MMQIIDKHNRFSIRRLILGVCGLLLVALCFCVVAKADNEPKVVRVGYYENEVFQEGAKEGVAKSGYAYEYYRKLSEYTGWEYEYVYGDYGELYQMLLDGEIDLLAGLAYRDDRAAIIGYPNEVMGVESYYLVKHDDATNITAEPSTLNGCKIGVLDSAMVGVLNNYLDEHGVRAEVVTYSDYTQLFDAFDLKEVDILAAESDGAHGREHSEVLTVFGTSDYYLCVNIKRKDLLSELNNAQASLAAEEPNFINSLRTKYYSVSVTARAFTQAEREWMSEHDTLNIGYLENYLPYSDTDSKGEVTGIVKDMVPSIINNLGMQNMTVNYKGYANYDEMIAAVSSGEIDAAFPVGGGLYNSEESGIYLTNPVSSSASELVYKGEFDENTTKHFAVNENNKMQYYFVSTNYPDAEITFYPSTEECLSAVLSGKAECATLNGLRANEILRNRKYADLNLYLTNFNDDRCFGVKIGNEGLLKLLNRGINVLGDGYAQSISSRYTGGLYSYGVWDFALDHMAIVSAVIIIIAVIIVFLLVRDSRRTRKEVEEKEKSRRDLEVKNKELADSQKALSDAVIAAESANRAKTTFLNNMSHDIRTPMNAIVGFTGLATSNIDDKEKVQDYLGKISVSSHHLLSLINDVLDMSSIESGNITIKEAEVHLPDVINDLQTIIHSSIESKELKLVVDTTNLKNEDVVTDKLRLKQVLLNILSNAVKFTPSGGTISFLLSEKEADEPEMAKYEFLIKDTGIGMSEEFQKTIFDAFSREKTSTVSGIQGTGLGMAIAKNIIEMMGGEISVKSEEGKGSEFTVLLPCRICEPKEKTEDKAEEMPDFTGKRVLLVEDNQMNQLLCENILKNVGLEVDIAGDGTEAVDQVKKESAGYYDIILMDIQMPKMDGYEATRQIRALDDKDKANIPIVAVTANAFEEDKQTAFGVGMNGHLAKPYDIPEIMKTLKNLLG